MKRTVFLAGLYVGAAFVASGQQGRTHTTGLTREGTVKRSTEETRMLPLGGASNTSMTSIAGKGEGYELGKAVSVTRGDGSQVNCLINDKSSVLGDLSIGKTVQVVPLFTNGPSGPFIQTITYVTLRVPPR